MHPKRDGKFDIRAPAGTGDEDQIVTIFRLCKDLMQVGPQHARADDRKVNARQQRDGTRLAR